MSPLEVTALFISFLLTMALPFLLDGHGKGSVLSLFGGRVYYKNIFDWVYMSTKRGVGGLPLVIWGRQ